MGIDFPPSLKLFLDDLEQGKIQAHVDNNDQIFTLRCFTPSDRNSPWEDDHPVNINIMYKMYCDRCFSHYQFQPTFKNANQFKHALMVHSKYVVDRLDNVAWVRGVYSTPEGG